MRQSKLEDALKKMGITSGELTELKVLESDADGYLGIAKELRHHATHRGGIPMQHYLNGPSNLVHPTTRKEIQIDPVDLFGTWLDQLDGLLGRWRANVVKP